MNKHYNNVWHWGYSPKYYLTHPWKWFGQLGRNIRAAHMRCTRGWCYSDVWDWDSWFMHTVPEMFRHLADKGNAYPGQEPFETPEKWRDWLHKMADQIESCTEEAQEKNNEYYKDYMKHIMDKYAPPEEDGEGNLIWPHQERTELDDKYFNRCKELGQQAQTDIEDVMDQLGKHFYKIWD